MVIPFCGIENEWSGNFARLNARIVRFWAKTEGKAGVNFRSPPPLTGPPVRPQGAGQRKKTAGFVEVGRDPQKR